MASKRKETIKDTTTTKKVKKDPAAAKLSQQIKEVTDALKTASIAAEVKSMLAEVLPFSLGEYSDRRHNYQEQVIDNISNIMKDVEADLTKKADEARTKHEEALSSKPAREKEAADALAQLEAAKAETQRLKVALAGVAMAFRSAQQSLAEAEATKKADAQKSVEASKRKGHFENALGDLKYLQTAAPEDAEASGRQSGLVSMLKKYKFEESMLIALPAALAKAPDSRGQFDQMAIAQLEGEISKKISEQEAILAAAKPDQEKCEAAVRKAEDVLKSARANQREAAKKYDVASKNQATCEEASLAANKAVKDLTKVCDKLKRGVTDAEVGVELFQQGPKETFRELRERSTPPPEEPAMEVVEEQAPEAEAVAEAVAAC
jgi:hypothetical protein